MNRELPTHNMLVVGIFKKKNQSQEAPAEAVSNLNIQSAVTQVQSQHLTLSSLMFI